MFFLETLLRSLLTSSINLYQQYLSPLKGFRCAHAVRYGGETCSAYIKRVLSEKSLVMALKLALARFQACGQASLELTRSTSTLSSASAPGTPSLLRLQHRRYFLWVTVPAFLLGLSTPALAAGRVPRGCGWSVSRGGYHGYRASQSSTDEGTQQLMQGLCCGAMVLGAFLSAHEER
ncbi:MAG: membrane protein insertion efficiency factor YidD [Gloeomargaritaceae cyanobacterium C42_A2020_066]|nr:membrane protein insertion efficiency factor YidD [Gloeomargaritaceae cyanobacterium C42_A2020_066]